MLHPGDEVADDERLGLHVGHPVGGESGEEIPLGGGVFGCGGGVGTEVLPQREPTRELGRIDRDDVKMMRALSRHDSTEEEVIVGAAKKPRLSYPSVCRASSSRSTSSIERTTPARSMMGFDGMPGTAVLPMCSIRRKTGPTCCSMRRRSAANSSGHSGRYSTSSMVPSVGRTGRWSVITEGGRRCRSPDGPHRCTGTRSPRRRPRAARRVRRRPARRRSPSRCR